MKLLFVENIATPGIDDTIQMTDRSISESTTQLTGARARDTSEYDFVNDNLISNVHLTGRVNDNLISNVHLTSRVNDNLISNVHLTGRVSDNLISSVHLTGRVTERENGSGVRRTEEPRISHAYDVPSDNDVTRMSHAYDAPSDNDVTMAPNTREEEEDVTHGTVRILALRKQQKVRETAAEALGHSYNNVRLAPKPPEKVTTVKSAKSDDPVTGQMRAPIFDI